MKKPRFSAHQAEFFKTRTKQAFMEHPYLKKLHKHLLRIGGVAVVLWNGTNDEKIAQALISSGKAESGKTAILKLGEQSECHENSAKLHRQDPGRYAVLTGYALSDDGIWRPHSWVHDSLKRRIIETTEKRAVYFGVIKFETQRSARASEQANANR